MAPPLEEHEEGWRTDPRSHLFRQRTSDFSGPGLWNSEASLVTPPPEASRKYRHDVDEVPSVRRSSIDSEW